MIFLYILASLLGFILAAGAVLIFVPLPVRLVLKDRHFRLAVWGITLYDNKKKKSENKKQKSKKTKKKKQKSARVNNNAKTSKNKSDDSTGFIDELTDSGYRGEPKGKKQLGKDEMQSGKDKTQLGKDKTQLGKDEIQSGKEEIQSDKDKTQEPSVGEAESQKGESAKSQKADGAKNSVEDIKKRIESAKRLFDENKDIIGKALDVMRIKYYRLVVTVGTDDPAQTGILQGLLGSLAADTDIMLKNLIKPSQASYVSAVPNFSRSMLKAAAAAGVRISVLRLLNVIRAGRKLYKDNKDTINYIIQGDGEK